MNGYSNNSFVQSLNSILSISDGMGTLISEGKISTGDIKGEDIIADTITVNSGTYLNLLSDSIVSLDGGFANLNSSNLITTINLFCNYIHCKKIKLDKIMNHFEHKICGYINLGISPYLKIPLTQSIYDTTIHIKNFNLSTYLTNTNNNTIILLPYYIATFYNDNIILYTSDNSSGEYPLFYDLINFQLTLTCTKILITYKNIII